jgi:hypothetical protein
MPGRGSKPSGTPASRAPPHLWPLRGSHVKPYGHTHGRGPTVSTANQESTTPFLISPTRPAVYDYHCLRVTSRTRRRDNRRRKRRILYIFWVIFLALTLPAWFFFFTFPQPSGFFTGKGERRGGRICHLSRPWGDENGCSYWMMEKGTAQDNV